MHRPGGDEGPYGRVHCAIVRPGSRRGGCRFDISSSTKTVRLHERIRYTDRFDDPNLAGEMHVTVTLRTVPGGTDLAIVQERLPSVIPVDGCYLGWQESLSQLASLVEPSIPDGA